MSLRIEIDMSQIEGGIRAFRAYPERLQVHLLSAMTDSMHEVTKELKDRVPVQTGNLRRSWNESLPPDANAAGLGYTGMIGSNASHAAAVEFGFQGIETVKGHIRSVVFGKTVAPFTVGAHTRVANQPAHPYVRPGLDAARDSVRGFHEKAVIDTWNEMKNAV